MTDWKPIETAPKDRAILLAFRDESGIGVVFVDCGKWHDDKCARKPKPHWSTATGDIFGRVWSRSAQYLGWMPLPDPPKESVK